MSHAIIGCDTVTSIFKIGKRSALRILKSSECPNLDLFKESDARYDISNAVEVFVFRLYGGDHNMYHWTAFVIFCTRKR